MDESGRCGPLCQHPSCWYSSCKRSSACENKGYVNYLQKLTSKHIEERSSNQKIIGCPTLKVHTMSEDNLPTAALCSAHCHKRALTLPPVKRSRKGSSCFATLPKSSLCNKVNFAQLFLQEDYEHTSYDGDLTFSPVLIWRPALKASNLSQQQQKQLQSSDASCHCSSPDRRDCVPMKTANMSTVLLPEERLPPPGTPADRRTRLARVKSMKRRKASEKGDFSDVSPYVVERILQQLKSEDETQNERGNLERSPSLSSYTHIPHSIACDLKTTHVYRGLSSPTTAPAHVPSSRTKPLSFSRSLAKQPLNALSHVPRPQSGKQPSTPKHLSAHALIEKKQSLVETHSCFAPQVTLSLELPVQPPNKHSSTSSVRYPYGNPCTQRPSKKEIEVDVQSDDGISKKQFEGVLQISPHPSPRRTRRSIHIVPIPAVPAPSFSKEGSQSPEETHTVPSPCCDGQQHQREESESNNSEHSLVAESSNNLLLGADLHGDQLVLSDNKGMVVHQLTRSEFDLDDLSPFVSAPPSTEHHHRHMSSTRQVNSRLVNVTSPACRFPMDS